MFHGLLVEFHHFTNFDNLDAEARLHEHEKSVACDESIGILRYDVTQTARYEHSALESEMTT